MYRDEWDDKEWLKGFSVGFEVIPDARHSNGEILAMSPEDVWAFFAPFMRLGPTMDPRDLMETTDLKPLLALIQEKNP